MIVSHNREVLGTPIDNDQIKNAVKKVLISPAQGWEGYVMREFELGQGGYTPRHTHPWPHINYILEGTGSLYLDGQDYALEAGSFAFVPSNELHQFTNTGEGRFAFICIVPEEGDK
ncbi:cupin domain-containing protein [Desulfosporosinus nitroreducens]|uniref:Cupin domain-containing protein n=1 Tax=Desulfosporosinus nitroreducens TaxID=2018668 RepID=A0ABT8QR41_9FIRM|nr:cupin domain-containing protein [Desulfosporosinus nitroreducens]MDO0823792.1 cupin domain-containing protein [Desulfosporosinus nitroreducens]